MNSDLWNYLANWLNDNERSRLMMTSKNMMLLNFLFNEKHNYLDIFKSSFYHNFTNITIGDHIVSMGKISYDGHIDVLPNNLRKLIIDNHTRCKINENAIPCGVKHVTFNSFEKYSLKGCIPSTVTHLFFNKFNTNSELAINGYIPISVSHLKINNSFKLQMKIPTNVKYLSLNVISDYIVPKSVTHLRFQQFNSPALINSIPSSVTHLIYDNYCGNLFSIPSTVARITLGKYFGDYLNFPKTIKSIST